MAAPRPGSAQHRSGTGDTVSNEGAAADRTRGARAARNGTLATASSRPSPFLKWAGGKGQLLPELLRRVPPDVGRYYEPMIGGGALFFALSGDEVRRPQAAVLNDANDDLMAAYRVVRDLVEPLIVLLGGYESTYLNADAEERARIYYEMRAREPDGEEERAARLLFLNRTCFNGLFRVNRAGRFNVPHGRYARPRILDAEALRAASHALTDVELRCGDVVDACEGAGHGDFVYLDPPFVPISATSSFTDYTAGSFGVSDQLRLRWLIDDLTERGACVMLSNSPVDWVRAAYETARYPATAPAGAKPLGADRTAGDAHTHHLIEEVQARRMINSRGDRRSAVTELIVINPPLVEALHHGSAL